MTTPSTLDLEIPQGKSWSEVLRWGSGDYTLKPFDATGTIAELAPLQIKVTAHGLTDGWPFRITAVEGLEQVNDRDFVCGVISADVIEVRELREDGSVYPVNAAAFSPYISGGYIEYEEPRDLAGLTMQWQGRESHDAAAAAFDFSTTLTPAGSGIVLDNAAKTITLQTAPADTAPWTFDTVLHEIEVTVTATGEKPPFVAGRLTVLREVVK